MSLAPVFLNLEVEHRTVGRCSSQARRMPAEKTAGAVRLLREIEFRPVGLRGNPR